MPICFAFCASILFCYDCRRNCSSSGTLFCLQTRNLGSVTIITKILTHEWHRSCISLLLSLLALQAKIAKTFLLLFFMGRTFLIPLYFHIYAESEDCSDSSKYCGLIVSFKMCHKDKYKSLCCSSCTKKAWNEAKADLKSISTTLKLYQNLKKDTILFWLWKQYKQNYYEYYFYCNYLQLLLTYELWNDVLDTKQNTFFEQTNSSTSYPKSWISIEVITYRENKLNLKLLIRFLLLLSPLRLAK